MEGRRFLDPRPVQPEPDPEHPFRDSERVGVIVWLDAVVAHAEPLHGEEKAGEAPYGDEAEGCEVGHHGAE